VGLARAATHEAAHTAENERKAAQAGAKTAALEPGTDDKQQEAPDAEGEEAEAPVAERKQEDAPVPRYEIYLDARMGAEAGAHTVSAGVSLLGAAEEKLFRPFEPGAKAREADSATGDSGANGAEGEAAGGAAAGGTATGGAAAVDADSEAATSGTTFPTSAGVALRALRTLVWDAPVAWWFGVMQHEVFGHGGRAREFGADPGVHLGSPWQGRGSYSSFDADGLSTEELLYIAAGGVEANGYAATFLERRAVAGVRMRPIDLLFLASNRLALSDYVLRTTPNPAEDPSGFFGEFSGGGDVAHYIDELLRLHGETPVITPVGVNEPVQREYEQLERQAIWNALDPGVWWALGSVVKMIARGDGAAPLPLPRWGRFRFLPAFSAEWTPSGGQVSLEWIAAREETSRWFSVIVRRGTGPSGSFGAIGGAIDDRFQVGPFRMGGIAEVWHDPRNGFGGGGRLRTRVARGLWRGFFFDVGVKSQGYWVGQPARPGLFGGIGINFTR
jgi:hypothetical protein